MFKNPHTIFKMWDYFDEIYCINLYSRPDKYSEMKSLFQKYNVPVVFHRVHRNADPVKGCFESHLELINLAYKNNYNNILIFEDDVSFENFTNQKLQTAIDFMKNNYFELFYFGSDPEIYNYNTQSTKYPDIYKIHSLCTHAYVINKSLICKMHNLQYLDNPIDSFYKYNKNAYGFLHPVVIQNAKISDISDNIVNRSRFIKWFLTFFICTYSKYINIRISKICFYSFIFCIFYLIYNFPILSVSIGLIFITYILFNYLQFLQD